MEEKKDLGCWCDISPASQSCRESWVVILSAQGQREHRWEGPSNSSRLALEDIKEVGWDPKAGCLQSL